jgi:spore germination protein GerM
VYEKPVTAQAEDVGKYGPFEHTIKFEGNLANISNVQELVLNVFSYSAEDGSEINMITVPLINGVAANPTMTVYAFFMNNTLDPEISCTKAFPVKRVIPKTQATAQAAIAELLKGLSNADKEQGYYTSINQSVKVNSLTIENKVAKIDFSQELQDKIAGSCMVSAIRTQIIETLKQFPTIQDVQLSIDGAPDEDILQP